MRETKTRILAAYLELSTQLSAPHSVLTFNVGLRVRQIRRQTATLAALKCMLSEIARRGDGGRGAPPRIRRRLAVIRDLN